MATKVNHLNITLLDAHGNVVSDYTTDTVQALQETWSFMVAQGTDPDADGADAQKGSIVFEPVFDEDDQPDENTAMKVQNMVFDRPLFDADGMPLGNPLTEDGSAAVKRLIRQQSWNMSTSIYDALVRLYPAEASEVVEESVGSGA